MLPVSNKKSCKCEILVKKKTNTTCNKNSEKKCSIRPGFYVQENYLCHIHCKIKYNKFVIIIQKVWNGYYIRKKLKTIYYKLPSDIQKLVLHYVRQDIYFKRYKAKVIKLQETKFDNYIINFKQKFVSSYQIKNELETNSEYRNNLYSKIYNLYILKNNININIIKNFIPILKRLYNILYVNLNNYYYDTPYQVYDDIIKIFYLIINIRSKNYILFNTLII